MLSKRPWIDRIVRESEFVDPGLFREYYERLARGYARGVRQAQLAGEVDARYDPEVIAYLYTGVGNFIGMRWADWTAGGQVPEDVLDDMLEVLARGLPPRTKQGPDIDRTCPSRSEGSITLGRRERGRGVPEYVLDASPGRRAPAAGADVAAARSDAPPSH